MTDVKSVVKFAFASLLAPLFFFSTSPSSQAGILYVANGPIDSINSLGQISTFALSSDADFIAIGPQGNLYISFPDLGFIEKYSPSGTDLGHFASGLNVPQGLAFDAAGNLYVAVSGSNSVEKFNSSGGGTAFVSSGLDFPVGLAFNAQGDLFVGNVSNSTVEEFNSSGSLVLTLSTGLSTPGGLAIDASGDLFAANQTNANIEEYAATSGGLVSTTGTNFASTGPNSQPTGLAFDDSGNLYVSYAYQSTSLIEKFNSSGSGTVFASGGNLDIPLGLAFSAVPEPSAATLGGLALAGLLFLRWRRKDFKASCSLDA